MIKNLSKSKKFFLQPPNALYKGYRFFGCNNKCNDQITLQDLIDFVKDHNINPSRTSIPIDLVTFEDLRKVV